MGLDNGNLGVRMHSQTTNSAFGFPGRPVSIYLFQKITRDL